MVSCIERARRKPTEDLNAYEAYQRGLYHFNRFRLEDMAKAKQGFERAIELDPNYASAISRLASVQTASAAMGWPVEPGALDRALELADRAQALEPSAHHVYVVRAGVHLNRSESREAEAAANQGFAAHDRSEIPALIVKLRRAGLP